jgi:hypothetical protein
MLRRVIVKYPNIAASLQLTEQRIASWEPRDGLNHCAVATDIAKLHEEASVVRCDLSKKNGYSASYCAPSVCNRRSKT